MSGEALLKQARVLGYRIDSFTDGLFTLSIGESIICCDAPTLQRMLLEVTVPKTQWPDEVRIVIAANLIHEFVDRLTDLLGH